VSGDSSDVPGFLKRQYKRQVTEKINDQDIFEIE